MFSGVLFEETLAVARFENVGSSVDARVVRGLNANEAPGFVDVKDLENGRNFAFSSRFMG